VLEEITYATTVVPGTWAIIHAALISATTQYPMNTAVAPWLPTPLAPLFTLSYPTEPPLDPDAFETSNFYHIGRLDGLLLVTMIAFMAIARDMSRLYLLEPLARWKLMRDWRRGTRLITAPTRNGVLATNGHANGNGHGNGNVVKSNDKPARREKKEIDRRVVRFAEQGWQVIYYTYQWCVGMVRSSCVIFECKINIFQYVYNSLPSSLFNTDPLWQGYPHIPLPGPVKFYYISQIAYYMHAMLVLHAEAHRSDHLQMMLHHVITVVLMVCSYSYNFTRVGCMIMVLMDWCDIWLPVGTYSLP
jgi:acyl-CoA-dependent ceramide synthase